MLRKLWRKIPRPWRDTLFHTLCDVLAQKPRSLFSLKSDAFVVGGFFSAHTGLGRSAELLAQTFERCGKRVYRLDISPFFIDDALRTGDKYDQHIPDGIPLILHVNPPLIGYTYLRLGRSFIKNRNVVGYWAFELDDIPPSWKRSTRLVNRIWAASTFCRDSFQSYTLYTVPIVRHPTESAVIQGGDRSDWGLNAADFVVLFTFGMGSGCARKNPEGVIRAFQKAFSPHDNAILLIKIANVSADIDGFEALKKHVQQGSRIRFMTENIPHDHVMHLMSIADVYISLHRSEGFGLPIAEALLLNKPVIATGFSGNLDFMKPDSSFLIPYTLKRAEYHAFKNGTCMWAYPDEDKAAQSLRALYDNRTLGCRMGIDGGAYARSILSFDTISAELLRILSDEEAP